MTAQSTALKDTIVLVISLQLSAHCTPITISGAKVNSLIVSNAQLDTTAIPLQSAHMNTSPAQEVTTAQRQQQSHLSSALLEPTTKTAMDHQRKIASLAQKASTVWLELSIQYLAKMELTVLKIQLALMIVQKAHTALR